jgi:hypothetical protein
LGLVLEEVKLFIWKCDYTRTYVNSDTEVCHWKSLELFSSMSHSHVHFPENLQNVMCQNSVCIREICAVLGSNTAKNCTVVPQYP